MTPRKYAIASYAAALPPHRRDRFARFAHGVPVDRVLAFVRSQNGDATRGRPKARDLYGRHATL